MKNLQIDLFKFVFQVVFVGRDVSGSKAPRPGCGEETGSRVPARRQYAACGFISRALQTLPDWRRGWQVTAQVAVPAAGALTHQGDLSSCCHFQII